MRKEALLRSAHLVARGHAPLEALDLALEGMERDEMRLGSLMTARHSELQTPWPLVIEVSRRLPAPWRRPDGDYVPWIVASAAAIESSARSAAGLPGYHDLPLDRSGLSYGDEVLNALEAMEVVRSDDLVEELELIRLAKLRVGPSPKRDVGTGTFMRDDLPEDESPLWELVP